MACRFQSLVVPFVSCFRRTSNCPCNVLCATFQHWNICLLFAELPRFYIVTNLSLMLKNGLSMASLLGLRRGRPNPQQLKYAYNILNVLLIIFIDIMSIYAVFFWQINFKKCVRTMFMEGLIQANYSSISVYFCHQC